MILSWNNKVQIWILTSNNSTRICNIDKQDRTESVCMSVIDKKLLPEALRDI